MIKLGAGKLYIRVYSGEWGWEESRFIMKVY